MATTAAQDTKAADATSPWQGFRTGLWQNEINVRDFIQQNYTPYDGDADFLTPATTTHGGHLEEAHRPVPRGAS